MDATPPRWEERGPPKSFGREYFCRVTGYMPRGIRMPVPYAEHSNARTEQVGLDGDIPGTARCNY